MRAGSHLRVWSIAAAVAVVAVAAMNGQQPTLASEYERLMKSYAAYKKYGTNLPLPDIEKRLSEDRLNTVRGLVRAALLDLNPGGPLVVRIEELRGIWGSRPGNTEGRHQFRLSVYFKPGVRAALTSSKVFDDTGGAHVLLPGGDDDPKFKGFTLGDNPETWRQVTDSPPRLQVSILESDERVGDIDVDFDTWLCHLQPSNSDVGSMTKASHAHLTHLNTAFPFPPDLKAACHNVASHCNDSYVAPYCK